MATLYTDANGQEIKKALSAYMHFCQERRAPLTATLKASLGASFANTMVMKELGAEWKALDSASKERFSQKAASDKERYDKAVASNPENNSLKPKKKKAKASKPKAPSAYMLFCADRRPAVTAALKASKGADFQNKMVMVQLGAEWRELSDDGKASFVEKAEAVKASLADA
eukprot:CAMPEP_0119062442 /NCGR_PEP_ID=MMETSP1178-20130426/6021_1 /TAXON_ID=33656 /ORGANISM="unid sp, Strain CCMP2000" /LENGTH=170 /DNA_ID=CAMNT_0007043723 /DNA_START=201 /DNA_END=713 /DNA_ORIENTATION=-